MDNIKDIKIPAAIFLDLFKAFDTQNFDILLYNDNDNDNDNSLLNINAVMK